jgi:signal transduction histidine kinase
VKPLPISDVLEAAAYAVVGERCRKAHLHDARGELQTLQSAIELLARAAKTPGENAALADKASALAKRALANHEKSLVELLNRMTPHDGAVAAVNLGPLVSEVLRILRNDALSKSIDFRFEALADVSIKAQPNLCEMVILGLCATTIDELAAGTSIRVSVGRVDSHAYIGWKSDIPWPAARRPEDLWHSARAALSPYELLLAVAWRWTSTNGGRVELPADTAVRDSLRIYYPIHLSG